MCQQENLGEQTIEQVREQFKERVYSYLRDPIEAVNGMITLKLSDFKGIDIYRLEHLSDEIKPFVSEIEERFNFKYEELNDIEKKMYRFNAEDVLRFRAII